MSELTEKIKEVLNPKVVVISVVFIIIGIYLFSLFAGDKNAAANTTSTTGGIVIAKDEKPRTRDYFEATREQNQLASKGILNEQAPVRETGRTALSDITDDEDALLLDTQAKIRESTLAGRQRQEYASPPSSVQQPQQVAALQQAVRAETPAEVKPPAQEPVQEQPQEMEVPKKKKEAQFYEGKLKPKRGNTFACVVHGDQEVMNGSTIKLRLMDEYTTGDGTVLEKGTTLWGVCSLTKERMNVTVQSVLQDKNLIELNFIAYDIDGLQGINLPNNVKAEIAKRVKAQALEDAPTEEVIGNNGILEKGANAVVNTTKNLLSRKQSEIKILVKSNYQLVLKPVTK